MNPESIEKIAPRLAVTKIARVAFIHRINMTQKTNKSQEVSTHDNTNTPTITHTVSSSIINLTEETQHAT